MLYITVHCTVELSSYVVDSQRLHGKLCQNQLAKSIVALLWLSDDFHAENKLEAAETYFYLMITSIEVVP